MVIKHGPADAGNVAQFWINILDDSVAENAMNDNNGNLWVRAQGGNPDILYFAGNDRQNHNRPNIPPVPPGKRLCVAVNPVEVTNWEVEAEAVTDKDLANNARRDEDSASKADLIINNELIDLIAQKYRCANGHFEINAPPAGTMWGIPSGSHPCAADGYYIIIEPLDPGDYTMVIDAKVDKPFPFKQPVAWTSKVTYKFRVVGPPPQ
jgi:hypothetical protein